MHRNTSPFIDEVAAQGIVFDNAMAHSSYTRESISALFTGLLPSSGGSIGYTAKPSARVSNLAELYEEAGYRTGLFSATTALNGPEFKKGFDETDFLAKQWDTSGLSRPLSDRALAFVDGAGDQKFMMYLHYFDPHGPYDPPEELYRRFSKKAVEKRLTLYHHARPLLPQLVEQGFGPGEERFEDLLLRYDAEIADVDRAVESLFQGLEDRGKLDNTLVVFTADHGEEFLDHGFVEHRWTVYREVLHVPLIFWAPGPFRQDRFSELVSHVDVLPTLLGLMEIPHSERDFDGASLFTRTNGSYRFNPPSKPFIGELMVKFTGLMRTVIIDDWKYIAAQRFWTPAERAIVSQDELKFINQFKAGPFDPWGAPVREELYALADDPKEQRNVIGEHPDKVRELQAALADYEKYCKLVAGTPSGDGKLTPEEVERLRSLGYLGGK